MTFKKQMKLSNQRYQTSQKQNSGLLTDSSFRVSDNLKAEYDMWSWIYQEIANLRLEVSRLGAYVRVNNNQSPNFLEAYHSHIYSLLLPISVVVSDELWKKIEGRWLEVKNEINEYLKQKKVVHNKRIPFELIRKLDNLYRISLLVAQKAGLGFKVEYQKDVELSIEKAITASD